MEVPRFWRSSPSRIGFRTETITDENNKPEVLRYPWGEIPLNGGIDEVYTRLIEKGFNEKTAEEILFSVFGGVTTESSVSSSEVVEGVLELLGSEVGEKNGSKV